MVISTANTSSLDWLKLSADTEQAYVWIKTVLATGKGGCLLQPTAEQEQQLWHFFWEQRTARRLRGQQELYFTYPCFVAAGESLSLGRSVLRWPCLIEPPTVARKQWQLSIDNNGVPQYNLAWVAELNDNYPHDWDSLLANCIAPTADGLRALNELAIALSEHTPYTMDTLYPALSSGELPPEAEEVSTTGQIRWSARLELSTDNWERIFQLPTHWREPLTNEASAIGNLSLAKLNPQQYQAFRQIHSQRYVLVEGKQGTGKSHSILELLKLALVEGKRCLVVAAERNSLLQLQDSLAKKQLEDLSFLWQNEKNDLPVLRAMVNNFNKQSRPVINYDELRWRTDLARNNRSQKQLDENYQASRQRVFGDKSWFELIGDYLRAAKLEDKAMLSGQLQAKFFAFEPSEHEDIMAAITATRPLYEKLGTTHHPLQNLSAAIFIHQDEEESRAFIQTTTQELLLKAQPLQHRYVQQQSQYADELSTHHETYYLLLRTQLQQLEEQLEDSQNAFGSDTLRSGDRTLKLYGRFSDKYRRALAERSAISEGYETLKDLHSQRDSFTFEWPYQKASKLLPQLGAILADYRKELEQWRNSLSAQIQEELIRLNHKTALPELSAARSIEPLEEELEVFMDEVNARGLYQLPLQSKTLTLARQQKYLEEIIDRLEQTRDGLVNYEDFFAWQRNWFSLSERARKSIQALLRARPQDWSAAFQSWYFNECLQQHYTPFPVLPRQAAERYSHDASVLRQQLPEVIRKDWSSRRKQAQTILRSALQQETDSLAELVEQEGAALANFYPITLANPHLGTLLAPYYDLVILENAGSLTTDNSAGLLSGADQLVAFANPTQVGDQYRELVTLLRKGDIPRVIYPHPELATLPTHWNQSQVEVSIHQLDGRFNEQTQTNEVEALEILQRLNSIRQTPQKTYPSVGIITLTMEQRDAILQLFYRIKRERSPGAELIQQLERNGLQVLFGNDAIAQQFDILFVSTVYGPIDHQGRLSAQLATLNDDHAFAGLSILESVLGESKSVHFINSIPLDELRERLQWTDRPGEQYLAHLLLLAQAEASAAHTEINQLSQYWTTAPAELAPASTLLQELHYLLQQELPEWQWTIEPAKGIQQLAILANSPTNQQSILLPDGFVGQDRHTSHDWENWQREKLELAGYRIISYSSEQLWKNAASTARKIAQEIRIENAAEEEE